MKKLKIIAIWMMFLIVTLPFYSSSVFAQFNGNSKFNESMDLNDLRAKYGVRGVEGIDIDKACFEKNAEDQGIIEVMNNQVVHIIESIFLILYLINTVINAIDLVYRTVGLIIGYISQPCFGFFFFGPWGGAACAFNEANVRGFEIGFFANDIVSCLISCPCTENSKCPGLFTLLLPKKLEFGGLGDFSIGAYDNIYTAIGCLCIGAVLFNLRKLVTIYETYNCCVAQSCAGGFEVAGCEAFLEQATCQYWEAAIMKTAIKFLMNIFFEVILSKVLEKVFKYILTPFVRAGINLYTSYQNILGLFDTFKMAMRTFRGANCKELGYDIQALLDQDIAPGFEPGFDPEDDNQALDDLGTVPYNLVDKDGDGIWDAPLKGYDKVKLKKNDFPNWASKVKAKRLFKYTVYDPSTGEPTVYYSPTRFIGAKLYTDGGTQLTSKQLVEARKALASSYRPDPYGAREPRPYKYDVVVNLGTDKAPLYIEIQGSPFRFSYKGATFYTKGGSYYVSYTSKKGGIKTTRIDESNIKDLPEDLKLLVDTIKYRGAYAVYNAIYGGEYSDITPFALPKPDLTPEQLDSIRNYLLLEGEISVMQAQVDALEGRVRPNNPTLVRLKKELDQAKKQFELSKEAHAGLVNDPEYSQAIALFANAEVENTILQGQIDQLQKDIEATENDALKKAYQAEIEALKTEMQTNKELTTKAQAYVDRRIAELEKIVSEIPLNSAEAVLAEELEALKQAREDLAERNRLLQEEQSKQATIKEREAIRVADEVRASAVKGATLKLLNTALEEFAFPEIDAMCEETQEASEPVAMEPIDNTVGNPLTSTPNATKKNCKFPVTTGTAHIERLRVFKDNSNGARGRYLADPQPGVLYAEEPNFHNKGYFTIKSCKENIAYRVDYVGQGSKEIESGNIGIGNSSQLKIPFSDETSLYEEICITVSDTEFGENGKRCFDSVMLYEHTQSGVFSMSFYSNSSFPSQPEPDLDVNVYLYQNITDQLTQTTLSVEDVAFFITDGAEAFFSDETLTKAEVKSYLDDSSSDFIGPSEINENQILERVEGGERLYIAP